MVFEELRRQKRVVAELRAQVAAGRILSSVRRITSKDISKRQPYSLRDAEGQQVEDQSRWGDIVHEHFKEKFKSDDAVNPETTRRMWRHRVRMAIQNGHSPGELSFEEFRAAMELMKPNVATGRDTVLGTILLFLLEATKGFLYNAVVERVAVREDTHVKDWAEFDVGPTSFQVARGLHRNLQTLVSCMMRTCSLDRERAAAHPLWPSGQDWPVCTESQLNERSLSLLLRIERESLCGSFLQRSLPIGLFGD